MKKIVFLICILMLQGCFIQSLEPFYTPKTSFEDVSFKGEWLPTDSSTKLPWGKPWVFSGTQIFTFNEKGVPSTLETRYFTIDHELFVDISASDIKEDALQTGVVNEWWMNNTAHVHSIFKVKFSGSSLDFIMLDYDWFIKKVKSGEIVMPAYENVYTVHSEDWVKFLEKYGNVAEAFNEKHALHFIKLKN